MNFITRKLCIIDNINKFTVLVLLIILKLDGEGKNNSEIFWLYYILYIILVLILAL